MAAIGAAARVQILFTSEVAIEKQHALEQISERFEEFHCVSPLACLLNADEDTAGEIVPVATLLQPGLERDST
jgi:hypothetical protein